MDKKINFMQSIQGSGIVIKQIGLLEFYLSNSLPTCDKAYGEIKVQTNEKETYSM